MASDEPVWKAELLRAPHEAPDKAARVRRMFNGIAPRYELVNSLFSVGLDSAWRRKAVQLAAVCKDDVCLDVACGTGDFARSFASAGVRAVVGCDFAHRMLMRAVGKARGSLWCEADALRLPFPSASFSIASCAFGVRNFADLDAGLAEMFRVLRPGGRVVILEFTRPRNVAARTIYEFYSRRIMPVAATLISGDKSGAYRYLPSSVVSFLRPEEMCTRMHRAGFATARATSLTMGIVTVYVATRA